MLFHPEGVLLLLLLLLLVVVVVIAIRFTLERPMCQSLEGEKNHQFRKKMRVI